MTTSHGTPDDAPLEPRPADDVMDLLQARVGIRRRNNEITIRPIEPADRDNEQEFVKNLSPGSRYRRFLSHITELSAEDHAERDQEARGDGEKQIGVARYVRERATNTADVAIVVGDEWHGQGIGNELLRRVLAIARSACIDQAQSLVLRDNTAMLRLAERLGFALCEYPEDPVLLRIRKQLQA